MPGAVRMVLGGLCGAVVGGVLGFALALVLATPHYDGTFGMREALIAVPGLALVGCLAGVYLARNG